METTLFNLVTGKKALITRVEGGSGFQRKLATLNIRVGKMVKKITTQPFRGPVVIEIDGREITLGRGMTLKVFVEE